jgi:preprotein translocase subunit YajC
MLITPAYAQAAAGGDTNSMLMSLLPFALIFVIMYFLILRPQQKKVKDHSELVKNIRRGDTVVTSGGLVGKVTKVVDDDQIEFEISDGVRVRQMRQMISGVRAKGEPAKEKTDTAKDETSASGRFPRRGPRRIFSACFLGSDGSTRCCISQGGRRWRSL